MHGKRVLGKILIDLVKLDAEKHNPGQLREEWGPQSSEVRKQNGCSELGAPVQARSGGDNG